MDGKIEASNGNNELAENGSTKDVTKAEVCR